MLLTTCIKPYNPNLEGNAANKIVVSGRINNMEGWQEVNISRSSPVEYATYVPLSGCTVNVMDNNGNTFPFPDNGQGIYRAWIGQQFLVPGTSYKISIDTPEGDKIESSFDTLMPGPLLDSVYYIIEDAPTSDPNVFNRGMQFYVDLNATESDSKNYKWEIRETWEYHTAHPKTYYYDGRFHQLIPPDYSTNVCWADKEVRNVYDLSTKTLSQNAYHQFPLHFVDGHSSRLAILYSILVTQLTLSENSFSYWEQMRTNSNDPGGLYEKQPFAIKGNLQNLTNPDKEVLGYFYAVSESSKRYFYQDIEGLELDFSNVCWEHPVPMSGWAGYNRWDYPVYYYYNDGGSLMILSNECVDCRLQGGKLTKPDFWP